MRPLSAFLAPFVVSIIATTGAIVAQPTTDDTAPLDARTAARLQARLDEFIATLALKGLSASVIIPGHGTWSGASGISHDDVPIDTAMAFAYGSITKSYTAAAIMLLVQEGRLGLDDSLHEFIPTFANVDPNVTVRQLLQHTSGIANYMAHPDWYPTISRRPGEALTPVYVLEHFINPPDFAPGTSFNYSNTNFLLAGVLIEELTGQSYASFIRQRFLDPRQLTSQYMAEHEPAIGVRPHNWVSPQNVQGPGVDVSTNRMTSIWGTCAADGALNGNARDLARWGRHLFTGDVVHDSSLQLMRQFIPIDVGNTTGYGLGIMRFGTGPQQAWGHTGGIMGFTACLLYSPADSIVVSLLSNRDSGPEYLASQLMAIARQSLRNAASDDERGVRDAVVCFPNPVERNGTVRYTLRHPQWVELTLRNSIGETLRTLVGRMHEAGEHALAVDVEGLPTGTYFCALRTAGGTLVQPWVVGPR